MGAPNNINFEEMSKEELEDEISIEAKNLYDILDGIFTGRYSKEVVDQMLNEKAI